MKRKTIAVTLALITIILVSIFAALIWLDAPEFYVGVEVAYTNANASDVKAMVDKIKNYTNLVVIGSPEISISQSALNETCDYIKNAGLNFIILFTKNETYTTYNIFDWMVEARGKYGKNFIGIYRYDEPGGNQVDSGRERLVTNATSYSDAAKRYTESLGFIVNYYINYAGQVFTADY